MSRKKHWIWFAASLVATLAYGLFLQVQGESLSASGELPGAILDFEFAGSDCRAAEIVDLWRDQDLLEVATNQVRFDFLFLFLYPTAIAFGCLLARRHLGENTSVPPEGGKWGLLSALGGILARAQVLSGAFDAAENLALLRILDAATPGSVGAASGLATWAAIFASLKFGLVLAGCGYAAAGFGRWLWGKLF